jgi:hypothetical protein
LEGNGLRADGIGFVIDGTDLATDGIGFDGIGFG